MNKKTFYYLLFFTLIFFYGCYSPITNFQSISTAHIDFPLQTMQEDSVFFKTLGKNESSHSLAKGVFPFLFYRDCSRNGASWLYECQSMALQSLYYTILLQQPDFYEIRDIHMFFYPKKNYILFRIYDSKLLQK